MLTFSNDYRIGDGGIVTAVLVVLLEKIVK